MTGRQNPNSFFLTLFGFERAKSKTHILLIVLLHTSGWCLLFFLPVMLYPVRINDNRFVTRELVDKSILVILFYLNYYFLIPRFFEKKKYVRYFSLTAILFLIYMTQQMWIRNNYFAKPAVGNLQIVRLPDASGDTTIRDLVLSKMNGRRAVTGARKDSNGFFTVFTGNIPPDHDKPKLIGAFPPFREPGLFGVPKGIWLMTLNNATSSFALLFLMGGFIRLAYSFVRNQNEKKALENVNLNAEVNFLKSQINPHFLFNTLNSIYAQAHSRSDKTEFSILKLSDLLRYVLYDSGETKVELIKDIQYINNYIDLQRIRLSSKVRINYTVTGDIEHKSIAPLLLITFIENAFKHGISYMNASTVNINIHLFEETLTLQISNPMVERNGFAPGGLGLKNVTRRLDLLYPGKYELDIHQKDYLHFVNLKLDLKSD